MALRKNCTDAEKKLWWKLRAAQFGLRFRRQYSVDSYILDFYAPRLKLAVEVDGDSHFTDDALAYDARRSAHLARYGIEVLRFTNIEVLLNLDVVLTAIEEAVARRRATSP